MDSLKSYFSSEVMSAAGLVSGFLSTEEDWAYAGTLCFCFLVALFVLAFDRKTNPIMSQRKVNRSLAAGFFVTFATFSSEIKNGNVTTFHLVFSCIISAAFFAVMVSLSVWLQILRTSVTFFIWLVGTLLLLLTFYAAILDSDERSEWGKWAGRIILKGGSMNGIQW